MIRSQNTLVQNIEVAVRDGHLLERAKYDGTFGPYKVLKDTLESYSKGKASELDVIAAWKEV